MMTIRLAKDSDVPELAALYRQTVLANASQHYTPAQAEAWSAFGANTPLFRQFILGVTTFVIEDETGIVGFAGISDDGYVASAYVRHDYLGRGMGSALMTAVLTHAQTRNMPRLYGEASEFSRGLFTKFGFQLYDTEIVDRAGVQFERYLMEKFLTATAD